MGGWLPVREQLRLGWNIIRWFVWPRGDPAWVNITMLISVAAGAIGLSYGTAWPLCGTIAIAFAVYGYRFRTGPRGLRVDGPLPSSIVRVVSKTRFPWILAGILFFSLAAFGVTGLILAALGCAAAYGTSLRLHPRVRHGRCKGTGEVRGSVFTWTFRKCPRCSSGRLVRYGAGHFGAGHIQAEYAKARTARAKARAEHRWR